MEHVFLERLGFPSSQKVDPHGPTWVDGICLASGAAPTKACFALISEAFSFIGALIQSVPAEGVASKAEQS